MTGTKLILVEGLPGSGKTTAAYMARDILSEMGIQAELFAEGNLDHPADYDGVACFNRQEIEAIDAQNREYGDFIRKVAIEKDGSYFVYYAKLRKESGTELPEGLLEKFFANDIYELPLDRHIDLLLKSWKSFAEKAVGEDKIYIFDCCFIQNPLTISIIRDNAPADKSIGYVLELAELIRDLKPALIYVSQQDTAAAFDRVAKERPREWLEGFVGYYTGQGYGKEKGFAGIEGVLEVLRARKELEMKLFGLLEMQKLLLDNSKYDTGKAKGEIGTFIKEIF